MSKTKFHPVHENLDTSFVNLAALLRYLRARSFAGRVHVDLDEYDADVFLDGAREPRVRETDHTTGRTSEGEEALRRLLVRATAPGGLINVYDVQGDETAKVVEPAVKFPVGVGASGSALGAGVKLSTEEAEWSDLLRVSGELIAAVESAMQAAGENFAASFRAVRLEMADDYTFLDPSEERFEYSNGAVRLNTKINANAYASGVSECLRRVVERVARSSSAGGKTVRERIALKLAVLARRRQTELARFKLTAQLDRIAGTRVS